MKIMLIGSPKERLNHLGGTVVKKKISKLLNHAGSRNTLVSIEIAGNPNSLALVRKILATCSLSLQFSSVFINDIKLAVTEACTNVIKHAYHHDHAKRFSLSIEVNEQIFVVKVTYFDSNFNPQEIPTPDLNAINEGGLGVFIMRNIMDDVVYSVDLSTGTVCLCMAKILGPATSNGGERED